MSDCISFWEYVIAIGREREREERREKREESSRFTGTKGKQTLLRGHAKKANNIFSLYFSLFYSVFARYIQPWSKSVEILATYPNSHLISSSVFLFPPPKL